MNTNTVTFLRIPIATLAGILLMAAPGRAQSSPSVAPNAGNDASIRPFRIEIPDEALADLRQRIAATKWPERELVGDATQGVQLATMRKLAQYWATEYDWRKVEARLDALPQFVTTIDGLDIHFIHVRSKLPNALPVIITHGWPGSVVEQLKIKAYPKLIHYNRLPKGRHFAAWEQPELFVGELRTAFRSLRQPTSD